jgi:NAD(P)-dependent dehydrogenase (short-subunit alcohol dehydrogenase family)
MTSKTVVITGGSKGIGLSICESFLDASYTVFIGARSAPVNIPVSSRVRFIPTDVRDQTSVCHLIQSAFSISGRLDTLVNNAGYSQWRSLDKIDPPFLEDIFRTNLFGVFWGCKSASLVMESGASIINVSSIAGKRGSSNNSAYVASKFALNGLTQSLCKELGPKGIRVNSVCPVLVSTPGLLEALRSPDSPAFGVPPADFISNFIKANSALNRLPTGKEVGAACVFLASDAASAITGQNINVDCGVFPQ